MFDQVPARVWLLIAIAAIAFAPIRYIYLHVVHSPSRRDITQPTEDLGWRTSGQLLRSAGILLTLLVLAVFIFTPTAEQFARSPEFLPIMLAAFGAWALYTVPVGFKSGQIEPLIRGTHTAYERETQPRRFWASLVWNAILGCLFIWLSVESYEQESTQAVQDWCYDEQANRSPQEVLSACNKLISNADNSSADLGDSLVARGIAYHRLGDYRRAVADYSHGLRLDRGNYYAYYNRGLAHGELGDRRSAIADFTAAIRIQPNNADAYLERGVIFLDAFKLDEAVADFTKAHEFKPDDPWSLANRGIAYVWKKDENHAQEDFKAVRAIDPSNQVLLRGEALIAMNASDYKAAVDRLSEALKHDPRDTWSLRMRARAYEQLGEQEKYEADTDRLWRLTMEAKAKPAN
jgi:tetratricopeptide (TPR) repeat protein